MLVKIAGRLETTVAALVGEQDEAKTQTDLLRHLTQNGAPRLLANYARLSSEAQRALLNVSDHMATMFEA